MMVMEYNKGDRVITNNRCSLFNGRTGTVEYVSEGGLYWVRFDDQEAIDGPFYGWWLDPLAAETQPESVVV